MTKPALRLVSLSASDRPWVLSHFWGCVTAAAYADINIHNVTDRFKRWLGFLFDSTKSTIAPDFRRETTVYLPRPRHHF